MDAQAFHEALEKIWAVVRAANGYVDRQAPWTLRKTDPDRMQTVLYVLAESIRHLAIQILPFVPESADRMLDQLSVSRGAPDVCLSWARARARTRYGPTAAAADISASHRTGCGRGGHLMLIDSHCHLDFPDFNDELEEVVDRAREAGVETILTICTHVTRFDRVLAIAERFDNIFCTVGIHPHQAASEPEVTVEHLVRMADHPKVVGFGESGLDYFYEHSPRTANKRAFACTLPPPGRLDCRW